VVVIDQAGSSVVKVTQTASYESSGNKARSPSDDNAVRWHCTRLDHHAFAASLSPHGGCA
jgi:hypothetical protein